MKFLRNIVKNHYSQKCIDIIIIILNFYYFSSNSISTGKYPYIKKLLNGNYILLSHSNIFFADETLQSQFNIIPLNNIYGEDSNSIKNIASTTVSQLKKYMKDI